MTNITGLSPMDPKRNLLPSLLLAIKNIKTRQIRKKKKLNGGKLKVL
jgi:hypothetical protein